MGNRTRRRGFAVALMLAAAVAFAGEDDVLLSFSTPGPDCYADGSAVMEGEIYALVWTRTGATFAGFQADGTLLNPDDSEVVLAQPNARRKVVAGETVGYCYPTLFNVPATYHAAHADGRYELVLLDTRTTNADGVLCPAGLPGCVRGWGEVKASEILASSGDVTASGGEIAAPTLKAPGVKAVASVLPPGVEVPQPRITGIKVENGCVKLTIADTDPLLLYTVSSGETPAADQPVGGVQPVSGAASAAELTLSVPADGGGSRFFKVIRNP